MVSNQFTRFCLLVIVFFTAYFQHSHAQDHVHMGLQKLYASPVLDQEFKEFQVFELNTSAIQSQVLAEGGFSEVQLELGALKWKLNLEPSKVISPDYQLRVLTDNGLITSTKQYEKAFRGYEVNQGGEVRMTIDHDYISGLVHMGKQTYFIEPLSHYEGKKANGLYIVYKESDVIKKQQNGTCEEIHTNQSKGSHTNHDLGSATTEQARMLCLELELAIASDKSMFLKYGSIGAVENHNITVMNNVQANYNVGAFIHDIDYVIVTQFVVTGTDPWTASTAAATFLGSFRTWGTAGNFGTTFDLGQIWTDRDFDGTTIGIAYVDGLCSSFEYHALQDFTTNAALLRVMTSHEIGHNFNLSHDTGGGFIMSPSVSNTNTWSPLSISTFNSSIPSNVNANCLTACAGGGTPPTAGFNINPGSACINQAITLTNTSTGSPTSYSWSMPGGTPSTSTATNPTVSYATVGTKTITLTATNSSGSNSISQTVVINGAPTATWTSTMNGQTASFTYTGTGATSWNWNFGDGFTSSAANPLHTYINSGTYNVTLQVTGPCGTSQSSQSVTTGPLAAFTSNKQTGCAPLVVNFTNQSQGATSFGWQFPGGSPSTSNAANPVVTYANPGVFDVTLIATNAFGSSNETKFDFITVQSPAVASFLYDINGSTVTFTNTSSSATSYLWSFGDGGTSTALNPSHTYLDEGMYAVTLTATNSCGTSTVIQSIDIVLPPVAAFAVSTNSGCAPLSVLFTSTSSGTNLTYSWQFAGGNPSTSDQMSPTVNFVSPGDFSVTLTVTNSAGSNTAVQPNLIEVDGPPATDFVVDLQVRTLTCTNLTTGANSYLWTFGDGGTSTQTNPIHTYTQDGVYNVVLTSTNACGVSTYTETVTIASPPTAVILATPTTGCAPTTVQYTGVATPGVVHNWLFPGGQPASSSAQNPSVSYPVSGSFTTTYTVSNSAGNSTASQLINMGAGATPNFLTAVSSLTASFTNLSTNATSYLWSFGDNQSSTAASPVHTYAQDGIYTVTLSATNACGTNISTQQVVIVTPPTAAFSTTPSVGCAPLSVQCNNQSSANALNYQWAVSNGGPTANTPNPTFVLTTPGTYTITLTVTNPAGASTVTSTVTVNTVPGATFGQAVVAATANFSNTSTNATSFTWNFGDQQTSTATSPSHTYAQDGVYTVTLTANNACGSSTTTQTVTIVTPPSANFTASATSGCTPLTVNYTNQSSANATSYLWTFAGGNPSTSTAQNPSVVYSTAGTYNVVLTTTNSAGSVTETKPNYINIGANSSPNFIANISAATLTVQNNSANATGYLWAFGDGQTSTAFTPTHTYVQDGVYTVTLTTTNSCGTQTASQTVTVITPPSANFSATSTTGCAPLTTQFSNQSSPNATVYQWTFAGGTPATSTDANPVVVYPAPGVYTVLLTSTNSAGSDTETKMSYINVTDIPQAGFSGSIVGLTAQFSNSSTNATSYAWQFGDGASSNLAQPTHTYAADGVYTVVLTATNACGSTSSSQLFTVVTVPIAGFTLNANSGCAPLNVVCSNTSSANATGWVWTFTGGTPASSTDQNPTVNWATPGVYQVSLTVTNTAGSHTIMQTVTVNTVPQTSFTITTGGLQAGMNNLSMGATTYAWTFGDGGTSTEVNPTHTYSAPGNYDVVLIATNACGSTTYTQLAMITGTPPSPNYTTSASVGCTPFTVQFTDASVGSPTSWAWSFAGGNPATSTSQNPSVIYSAPGNFDVSLSVTNIFGTQTMTWTEAILVGLPPMASFTALHQNGVVTFTNSSSNSTSYNWSFGDGSTSQVANPTHSYTSNGVYTVTLNASNDCGSSVIQQDVQVIILGTDAPLWADQFLVLPNPASSQFEVILQAKPTSVVHFALYDVLGRMVMHQSEDFGSGSIQTRFDIASLEASTYYLRVVHGQQIAVLPLVIVR
jgi:PKD repeat protein